MQLAWRESIIYINHLLQTPVPLHIPFWMEQKDVTACPSQLIVSIGTMQKRNVKLKTDILLPLKARMNTIQLLDG